MGRLRCPRCKNVFEATPGLSPQCPQCGYGATSKPPVAAAPVTPPPATPAPTRRTGSAWFVAAWCLAVPVFIVLAFAVSATLTAEDWRQEFTEDERVTVVTIAAVSYAVLGTAFVFFLMMDFRRVSSPQIRMAKFPLSGNERAPAWIWAVGALVFPVPLMITYSLVRSRIRRDGPKALAAGVFTTKRDRRIAHKKGGFLANESRGIRMRNLGQNAPILIWVLLGRLLF